MFDERGGQGKNFSKEENMNTRFLTTLSIFLLLSALFVLPVSAAVTASISPSGTLSQVSNVPVVFSYDFTGGSADGLERIVRFDVKFNGQDQTQVFLDAAQLSFPSSTLVTAEIEYLFAPGTYTFATTIQLQGESPVTATTTFTVPGDEQVRRKNTTLSKISLFMHQWDGYRFGDWISIGNLDTFRNRLFSDAVQIYVDPDHLSDADAAASYVLLYKWKYVWTVYEQDIVIKTEPEDFAVIGASGGAALLWHEVIHAISHGLQLAGSSDQFSFNDDHLYIEWAETCIQGLAWLERFEDYVNANGTASPVDPTVAANARLRWEKFVRECNSSIYRIIPTEAQKAELTRMIGFDIDPDAIKNNYLSQYNYPPEYFDDVVVRIISPSNGTETDDNQVDVTANLLIGSSSSVTPAQVGFIVNGAVQYSTLSGDSFSTTAVLATGDNTITAGMVSNGGQVYLSQPIRVVSDAQNNRYHIRITWDKNDTDVDLHFDWSGGLECYYGNRTPNWGSPETSPRLDVDDTNGYGPENITIDSLPGPGSYKIFVYYFSDHGEGGTNVTATIYENGAPIFSSSRYMNDRETWNLLDFNL